MPDLQFAYRDEQLVAYDETHTLPLTEAPFDFHDYHAATGTRVLPLKFQQLVQKAIVDALSDRKKGAPLVELESYLGIYEKGVISIILQYANMYPYSIDGFLRSLMPHQITALDFALSRDHSLFAIALGLGKTPTSYAYLLARQVTRGLIVCPASLKANWLAEAIKFLDHTIIVREITTAKKAKDILAKEGGRLYVVSYELLDKVLAYLTEYDWDAIVYDEAHALKNSKSLRSKAAFALRKKAKHILLLTGTPAASAAHFWNILRYLDPVIFADFFHYKPATMNRIPPSSDKFFFAERYLWPEVVYAAGGRPKWAFRRSIRMEELHALTRQYVIRQRKEDFLDLPPLTQDYIIIGTASQAHKRELGQKLEQATEIAQTKGDVYAQAILGEQVRKTAIQKLPFVLKYLSTYFENPDHEKCIVWAHSKEVIKSIHEHLDALKIKHILINGDTPRTKRSAMFSAFEHDLDVRVAVLSLQCCSTGLNLAFVNVAIYAELTFFYIEQTQSMGRMHRIGQKADKVVLLYLILKDSTDEMLWKSLLRKTNNESLVLDNKTSDFLFEKIMSYQNVEEDMQPGIEDALEDNNSAHGMRMLKKKHLEAFSEEWKTAEKESSRCKIAASTQKQKKKKLDPVQAKQDFELAMLQCKAVPLDEKSDQSAEKVFNECNVTSDKLKRNQEDAPKKMPRSGSNKKQKCLSKIPRRKHNNTNNESETLEVFSSQS